MVGLRKLGVLSKAAYTRRHGLLWCVEVDDRSTEKQRCGIALHPIHINSDGGGLQKAVGLLVLYGPGGNLLTMGNCRVAIDVP